MMSKFLLLLWKKMIKNGPMPSTPPCYPRQNFDPRHPHLLFNPCQNFMDPCHPRQIFNPGDTCLFLIHAKILQTQPTHAKAWLPPTTDPHYAHHLCYLATQNYFEYIIKKHETVADNSPIKIYVKKTNK